MRHIIKSFLITVAIVYIAYIIVPTIDFGPDPKNILLFLGGLWIISQVINPIFSIVLLPINLLMHLDISPPIFQEKFLLLFSGNP